ncbi:hypothetical protein AB0J55_01635 [Amycolatopsis sp. NPDC049688]|uniref:hypothetical protein n=1 Tax=Amycolatopsis sp. NPDC049688 TaxID=3154733 RepID=UPI003441CE5D
MLRRREFPHRDPQGRRLRHRGPEHRAEQDFHGSRIAEPDRRRGKSLQVYNRTAAGTVTVTSTKPVGGHSFTYTSTAAGQAFAVQRGATEFALVSTFTLPTTIGSVTSAQTGSYNADDVWVTQGPKSYTVSGSTIVIKLAKNECVRVIVSQLGFTPLSGSHP